MFVCGPGSDMKKQHIYYFGGGGAEGNADAKAILGGKGASLAAMSAAGLPVPPGFTISTECCQAFLDNDGRWPDGLEQTVREYIARLEEETGRLFGAATDPLLVSVRSGAARSMPGMMDTILNCGLSPEMGETSADPEAFWHVYFQFVVMFAKTVAAMDAGEFDALRESVFGKHHGKARHRQWQHLVEESFGLYASKTGKPFPVTAWDALVECIDAVFNSWNNDRAVTYRREHDIRDCYGTGVNVQSMFPSEVSGIVFTTNPNEIDVEEMVMESSYGLGEAVVSGDVHPDNFIVDRKTLEVKRSLIGDKTHTVAALGDQTEHIADAASLTDEQIRELAEISLNAEKFFGHPVDLEWGLAKGKFALLQSRAIRGLEIIEDVEIGRNEEMHRLVELAGNKRKVWVLHNLAETLPTPTPLTWDIVREFMSGDGGFGRMYTDFGYSPSQAVRETGFLELICGRIYADPERAAALFWDKMPLSYDLDAIAKAPKLMDAAPTKFDAEKADAKFLASFPRTARQMLRCSKDMKKTRATVVERFEREVLPSYLQWVRETRTRDLAGLSTGDLLKELRVRTRHVLDEFGGESLKPGFFGGLAQAGLEASLARLMGDEAGTTLTLTLTQGLEGDTTIEQGIAMWEVARGKRDFDQFLEEYGHRAVEEMELSKQRWREDRAYVEQMIRIYADDSVASPHELHEANVAKRRETEAKLPEILKEWGGSVFLEDIMADLKDAQKMLPYRESAKHYLMMGYETIRRVLTTLGDRWNLGRDIFFLTRAELAAYEGKEEHYAESIAARKIRWQSARQLDMAEVVDTEHIDQLGLPKQYDAAAELKGEPIASGTATAVARIVEDPSNGASYSDYILICHSTDPGWTALFARAKGLVVEKGGVLSHGAIVARDYGIPAVVCPDATKRIPDGTKIRIDGNRGVIALLEEDGADA